MVKRVEKWIAIVVGLLGTGLGIYSCCALIYCSKYISKLVEQSQLNIKDNLFLVVNYYMNNGLIYFVYGVILVSIAMVLYRMFRTERDYDRLAKISVESGVARIKGNEKDLIEKEELKDALEDVIEGFEIVEKKSVPLEQNIVERGNPYEHDLTIKSFNMTTMVLEIYETMELCLKKKDIKLLVDPNSSFNVNVMVDSEMGIRAVSDILWWSADFLEKHSEISMVTEKNRIDLKFPLNHDLLGNFQQNLRKYQQGDKDFVLYDAMNFIYNIRGELKFDIEKQMIQVIFPFSK